MCARLLSARIICGIRRQDMRALISNDFRELVGRKKRKSRKKRRKEKKEMRKKAKKSWSLKKISLRYIFIYVQ